MPERYVILTGEFPPEGGGVADHSRLVAEGLAATGSPVHVVAPGLLNPSAPPLPLPPGVTLHRIAGPGGERRYGPRALRAIDDLLANLPNPNPNPNPNPPRLLVQYVPHAFGYKALNLPFALWLYRRSRQHPTHPITTLFHEVAYPWDPRPWARTNLLAATHRAMAALIARASTHRVVATQRWTTLLDPVAPASRYPTLWQPVPSNLPTTVDPAQVGALRASLRPASGGASPPHQLLGHFGSYGRLLRPHLHTIFPRALDLAPRAHLLLIGRAGTGFREQLVDRHPRLSQRVHALGELPGDQAANAIAACDVLIQPYEDGAGGRRGSLMAALALGRCVVTNPGPATEPLWDQAEAMAFARLGRDLAETAAALLTDPHSRIGYGKRAAALYRERCALEHTLAALRC